MKQFTPDYLNSFKCIADKCKHSCCIGWEIDIDKDSLEYYNSVDGDFGKRLSQNIKDGHFILHDDERCPFLNKSGLCDIYAEFGEDALCQICTDHPRFRNFFTGAVETGLGLCCEEAARIILSQKDVFSIDTYTDEESGFFRLRNTVFDIIQDREFSFTERCENLCDYFGIKLPQNDWKSVFLSLEILDPYWRETVKLLDFDMEFCGLDTEFEQLLCYFVFRHLADGIEDGRFIERILFCVLACKVINAIVCKNGVTFENVADAGRRFSCEIEYSDENIDKLLYELSKGVE